MYVLNYFNGVFVINFTIFSAKSEDKHEKSKFICKSH